MDVGITTILSAATTIAGVAATWGALRVRIASLETRVKELAQACEQLKELSSAADGRLDFVRTDQGRRLGELEKTTNALVGRFDGFIAGRRSRTAAHGHKVNDEHG